MFIRVLSPTLVGMNAKIIEVEVDIARGERKISIIGLPDKAIQESKDRLISAFRNSQIELGPGHKVINLAPADIPKTGPSYDLPMAVALLTATKQIRSLPPSTLFIGELSLNGETRPVKGMLAILDSIKNQGYKRIFIPESNSKESQLIDGIDIFPIGSLRDIVTHFNNKKIKPIPFSPLKYKTNSNYTFDMLHVKGQKAAKRALTIAAAGGHNILLSGVPGSGKTYLSKVLPSIMPSLSFQESLEITKLYSIAGKINDDSPFILKRPFRSPHHTSSQVSLVGGGTIPKPGEISLAHRGVLFLDEFTEFNAKTLEVLRQPLEDKVINISRANGSCTFPANFQLIAAMNPCKCGYYGDSNKKCICSPNERILYKKKISGPILDRIDMHVWVPKVQYNELSNNSAVESSYQVRQKVEKAREIQRNRFKDLSSPIYCNAEMGQAEIKEFIKLDNNSKKLLKEAIDRYNLSARSYYRMLKVSRTIADLESSENICAKNIAEALSYRFK